MSNAQKILDEVKKELEISEKVDDIFEEATTAGMQMRTYESKKAAAVGAIAVSLAKKHHDPMFDRLKHFRKAWKETKDQILQRYYSQAVQQWQSGQNR